MMEVSNLLARLAVVVLAVTAMETNVQAQDSNDSTAEHALVDASLPVDISITIDDITHTMTFVEDGDGDAIYQGDIILGRADEFAGAAHTPMSVSAIPGLRPFGLATRNEVTRWPKGVLRYAIAANLPNKERVERAIAHWEKYTNIRFERISQPSGDFVGFVNSNKSTCSSAVGRTGGEQRIKLSAGCTVGSTIHEIGHALGLNHEQSRKDRNNYVRVNFANIEPNAQHNFRPDPIRYTDVGTYCTSSIMHYGAYYFAKNPAVETITSLSGDPIGQRDGLAKCDIETIEAIYKSEYAKR